MNPNVQPPGTTIMHPRLLCLVATVLFLSSRLLLAEEGMWLLDNPQKLPLEQMRARGFALDPADLCRPGGTGLMSAVVQLGGGTGSFISAGGLLLTNHHVAFGSIQSISTVEHDYLKNGFLAATHEEEIPVSTTAEMILSMTDVTDSVLAAVTPGMTESARSAALQQKMRALEAAAKGTGNLTCRVSELYQGGRYLLFTSLVFRDIRLVYAPPSSIGNFGGEVDNWMWPRHTGDFSIVRAYVAPDGTPAPFARENVPYHPQRFLPIAARGVADSAFTMVIGFPGRTYRYREAAGIELARDGELPSSILFYKARIDAIESAIHNSREAQIKYAAKLRRLSNPYKKYLGVLEGMRQADVVAAKRREEQALAAWITATPERAAAYGSVLPDMQRATDSLKQVLWKNAFFANLNSGVEVFAAARRFLTYVEGFPKDDAGSVLPPTEEQRQTMRKYLADLFKDLDLNVDRQVMAAVLRAGATLPREQGIQALRNRTGDGTGAEREARIQDLVRDLYDETRLATEEGCLRLMDEDADDILDDPMIRLARACSEEQVPVTGRVSAHNAAIAPLRRLYVEAWRAWQNNDAVYPDANRTIRLTFGRKQGLLPRDAVELASETTLRGVVEKATREGPFIVPEGLRTLWERRDFGTYADQAVGDVPVAFIADLDITGGNSGSPVLNGRGELVGCAFDGNWESVVGDYVYQERYNRSINVDVRYILFLLDKFAGARKVLNELVIK
jgi:hypothetical protein